MRLLHLRAALVAGAEVARYQPDIEELIAQNPDITLFDLREALVAAEGVGVHQSSIAALLLRIGFTCETIAPFR